MPKLQKKEEDQKNSLNRLLHKERFVPAFFVNLGKRMPKTLGEMFCKSKEFFPMKVILRRKNRV